MIIQMLNALEPLVAYGFYWDPKDVKSIMDIMVTLIRGNPQQFICMGYMYIRHFVLFSSIVVLYFQVILLATLDQRTRRKKFCLS